MAERHDASAGPDRDATTAGHTAATSNSGGDLPADISPRAGAAAGTVVRPGTARATGQVRAGTTHSAGRVRPDDKRPTVMLLGAGNRGRTYTDWILQHPGLIRVAGVADPDPARREYIRTAHHLPAEACFDDWRQALDDGPSTDAVIVATQDRQHTAPAIAALEKGRHVLLEKPMATSREDVLAIAAAADRSSGSLSVCHVLRYSALFMAVKSVIDEGLVGEIQSIFHAENVAYYHFAHSYVRGNWSNSRTSSPLILAKSCHDLDLICWIAASEPTWICSTAGQGFFVAANAPNVGTERCTAECPIASTCPYEVEGTYLHGLPLRKAIAAGSGPLARAARFSVKHPALAARLPGLSRFSIWKEWPTSTITNDLSEGGIRTALQTGPYGRCVFRCDNDQPDHQETIIRFANGITATFRLHGRSSEEGRTFRIDGSKATLKGRFGSGTVLELFRHGCLRPEKIPVTGDMIGHSGADDGIMEAWSSLLTDVAHQPRRGLQTDARTSLVSHLLAFAAAESAATGLAIDLAQEGPAPSTGRS